MAEQDPIEAYIAGFDTSQQQQLTAMDRILRLHFLIFLRKLTARWS